MGSIWFKLLYWMAIVVIVVVSVVAISGPQVFSFEDKLFHFAAYAILAVLGCFGYPTQKAMLGNLLFLILLGVALEVVQSFLPNRSAEVADFIANTLGVVGGGLVCHYYLGRVVKKLS